MFRNTWRIIKLRRNLTALNFSTNRQLLVHPEKEREGSGSGKEEEFNFANHVSHLWFPLGLGMVFCDSERYVKHEKRLFKAAQYGLTHEIET